jgi:pimeloyl-ACP methyl ester carboxylesterase
VPTCVICGQDDQLTPPRFSQYLADHIAKAELHILPQAGHMVMLEKPDQVADIFEDFLATVPYPS